MQYRLSNQFCPKTQGDAQYLVHLLDDRASSSYVALAGLHHNLLAHPYDRLPEGDVGEGSAHSAGTHFQLHLHGVCEPLVSCAEEALLIGITIQLHITESAMSNCYGSRISWHGLTQQSSLRLTSIHDTVHGCAKPCYGLDKAFEKKDCTSLTCLRSEQQQAHEA